MLNHVGGSLRVLNLSDKQVLHMRIGNCVYKDRGVRSSLFWNCYHAAPFPLQAQLRIALYSSQDVYFYNSLCA